jgi:hypothetical protein
MAPLLSTIRLYPNTLQQPAKVHSEHVSTCPTEQLSDEKSQQQLACLQRISHSVSPSGVRVLVRPQVPSKASGGSFTFVPPVNHQSEQGASSQQKKALPSVKQFSVLARINTGLLHSCSHIVPGARFFETLGCSGDSSSSEIQQGALGISQTSQWIVKKAIVGPVRAAAGSSAHIFEHFFTLVPSINSSALHVAFKSGGGSLTTTLGSG